MRILICDDDLEMSMQLKEILQCFFSTSSLNIPEITIYNNGTDFHLPAVKLYYLIKVKKILSF